MTYTFEDLIEKINVVYPDNFILDNDQRGPSDARPVELLAAFVVAQMRELYDPHSSDRENLSRIVSNLEVASAQLGAVNQRLRELLAMSVS
jgi:hypothetical protein